jgi:hypothetical protein
MAEGVYHTVDYGGGAPGVTVRGYGQSSSSLGYDRYEDGVRALRHYYNTDDRRPGSGRNQAEAETWTEEIKEFESLGGDGGVVYVITPFSLATKSVDMLLCTVDDIAPVLPPTREGISSATMDANRIASAVAAFSGDIGKLAGEMVSILNRESSAKVYGAKRPIRYLAGLFPSVGYRAALEMSTVHSDLIVRPSVTRTSAMDTESCGFTHAGVAHANAENKNTAFVLDHAAITVCGTHAGGARHLSVGDKVWESTRGSLDWVLHASMTRISAKVCSVADSNEWRSLRDGDAAKYTRRAEDLPETAQPGGRKSWDWCKAAGGTAEVRRIKAFTVASSIGKDESVWLCVVTMCRGAGGSRLSFGNLACISAATSVINRGESRMSGKSRRSIVAEVPRHHSSTVFVACEAEDGSARGGDDAQTLLPIAAAPGAGPGSWRYGEGRFYVDVFIVDDQLLQEVNVDLQCSFVYGASDRVAVGDDDGGGDSVHPILTVDVKKPNIEQPPRFVGPANGYGPASSRVLRYSYISKAGNHVHVFVVARPLTGGLPDSSETMPSTVAVPFPHNHSSVVLDTVWPFPAILQDEINALKFIRTTSSAPGFVDAATEFADADFVAALAKVGAGSLRARIRSKDTSFVAAGLLLHRSGVDPMADSSDESRGRLAAHAAEVARRTGSFGEGGIARCANQYLRRGGDEEAITVFDRWIHYVPEDAVFQYGVAESTNNIAHGWPHDSIDTLAAILSKTFDGIIDAHKNAGSAPRYFIAGTGPDREWTVRTGNTFARMPLAGDDDSGHKKQESVNNARLKLKGENVSCCLLWNAGAYGIFIDATSVEKVGVTTNVDMAEEYTDSTLTRRYVPAQLRDVSIGNVAEASGWSLSVHEVVMSVTGLFGSHAAEHDADRDTYGMDGIGKVVEKTIHKDTRSRNKKTKEDVDSEDIAIIVEIDEEMMGGNVRKGMTLAGWAVEGIGSPRFLVAAEKAGLPRPAAQQSVVTSVVGSDKAGYYLCITTNTHAVATNSTEIVTVSAFGVGWKTGDRAIRIDEDSLLVAPPAHARPGDLSLTLASYLGRSSQDAEGTVVNGNQMVIGLDDRGNTGIIGRSLHGTTFVRVSRRNVTANSFQFVSVAERAFLAKNPKTAKVVCVTTCTYLDLGLLARGANNRACLSHTLCTSLASVPPGAIGVGVTEARTRRAVVSELVEEMDAWDSTMTKAARMELTNVPVELISPRSVPFSDLGFVLTNPGASVDLVQIVPAPAATTATATTMEPRMGCRGEADGAIVVVRTDAAAIGSMVSTLNPVQRTSLSILIAQTVQTVGLLLGRVSREPKTREGTPSVRSKTKAVPGLGMVVGVSDVGGSARAFIRKGYSQKDALDTKTGTALMPDSSAFGLEIGIKQAGALQATDQNSLSVAPSEFRAWRDGRIAHRGAYVQKGVYAGTMSSNPTLEGGDANGPSLVPVVHYIVPFPSRYGHMDLDSTLYTPSVLLIVTLSSAYMGTNGEAFGYHSDGLPWALDPAAGKTPGDYLDKYIKEKAVLRITVIASSLRAMRSLTHSKITHSPAFTTAASDAAAAAAAAAVRDAENAWMSLVVAERMSDEHVRHQALVLLSAYETGVLHVFGAQRGIYAAAHTDATIAAVGVADVMLHHSSTGNAATKRAELRNMVLRHAAVPEFALAAWIVLDAPAAVIDSVMGADWVVACLALRASVSEDVQTIPMTTALHTAAGVTPRVVPTGSSWDQAELLARRWAWITGKVTSLGDAAAIAEDTAVAPIGALALCEAFRRPTRREDVGGCTGMLFEDENENDILEAMLGTGGALSDGSFRASSRDGVARVLIRGLFLSNVIYACAARYSTFNRKKDRTQVIELDVKSVDDVYLEYVSGIDIDAVLDESAIDEIGKSIINDINNKHTAEDVRKATAYGIALWRAFVAPKAIIASMRFAIVARALLGFTPFLDAVDTDKLAETFCRFVTPKKDGAYVDELNTAAAERPLNVYGPGKFDIPAENLVGQLIEIPNNLRDIIINVIEFNMRASEESHGGTAVSGMLTVLYMLTGLDAQNIALSIALRAQDHYHTKEREFSDEKVEERKALVEEGLRLIGGWPPTGAWGIRASDIARMRRRVVGTSWPGSADQKPGDGVYGEYYSPEVARVSWVMLPIHYTGSIEMRECIRRAREKQEEEDKKRTVAALKEGNAERAAADVQVSVKKVRINSGMDAETAAKMEEKTKKRRLRRRANRIANATPSFGDNVTIAIAFVKLVALSVDEYDQFINSIPEIE